MCLAHLHPKAHICAKFHENWSKTEEVVRDARLAPYRPTDRQPARRHADSYMYTCTCIWVRILNDVQLGISDLEHFYYTWFAPSYSETISFGVVVKSTIRAFRKHILYIPLLAYVHHTGLQMQKNDKKWCFYTFSFFWNHPVNFQAPLLILSNYSVNLVCLGPVS